MAVWGDACLLGKHDGNDPGDGNDLGEGSDFLEARVLLLMTGHQLTGALLPRPSRCLRPWSSLAPVPSLLLPVTATEGHLCEQPTRQEKGLHGAERPREPGFAVCQTVPLTSALFPRSERPA